MGTPDRCPTATLQFLIATLLTSPASSPRSWRRLTGVPASPPRTPPSSSSLVTLPSRSCCPASPCASSPSPSSLPLEGSLSGTWADRRRRCDQGHHPQGSAGQDHQGCREGQQEEVNRWRQVRSSFLWLFRCPRQGPLVLP